MKNLPLLMNQQARQTEAERRRRAEHLRNLRKR